MSSSGGNPTSSPFDKLFRPAPPPSSTGGNFTAPPLTSGYPTPPGPYSYSPFHQPPPPSSYLHLPPNPIPYPPTPTSHNPPNSSSTINSNPGARLMALLGGTTTAAAATAMNNILETAVSLPPPDQHLPLNIHVASSASSAPPTPGPARAVSGIAPRGRRIADGDRAVHDVDSRLPGEAQPPQLEVTPITKYVSDPGLVLGRQIAVNRTYICYGLKMGNIRVLNINTALRSLLKGHTQKVTDMAFFAEDVHLLASASVDGRVFVWKIDEGPDAENKPQITGTVIIAIQIVGEAETYHPRVCWHSHKQEILIVGIGKYVLKIDMIKVGRSNAFSADEPLKCHLERLVDGIQLIGRHDREVTDLSISQWMTTRLASASVDGTVKIWDDRKSTPLAVLKPHEGQPVNSVSFLTAPHCPEHIVLITAGPLNREVKIWVSTSEEGWLLPSESESWHCTQTLELRSSSEPRHEEAFFNQVVVLPRASLILLANAKKHAIYAVHVDYGSFPASSRMDYIADFTVAMPILSLTATSDSFSDGEQVVQVYCVQTQAIQQYALELSQCLPPQIDSVGCGKDSSLSRVSEPTNTEVVYVPESASSSMIIGHPVGSSSTNLHYPLNLSDSTSSDISEGIRMHDFVTSSSDLKPSAPPLPSVDIDSANQLSLPVTSPGSSSFTRNPSTSFEQGIPIDDPNADQSVTDYPVAVGVDSGVSSFVNIPAGDQNSGKNEFKIGASDIPVAPSSHLMTNIGGNTTHLITPFEILSGAISPETKPANHIQKDEEASDQFVNANKNSKNEDAEIIGDNRSAQLKDLPLQKEIHVFAENFEHSHGSESNLEGKGSFPLPSVSYGAEETHPALVVGDTEQLYQLSNPLDEEVQDRTEDMSDKSTDAAACADARTSSTTKGKKQKPNQSQASRFPSPSPSPFNSTECLHEPGSNTGVVSLEAMSSHISTMQEIMNQLLMMQKEVHKQLSATVAAPVAKEGKRMEAALGRTIEKGIKANFDALWARIQEENAKHDKSERDRMQQLTNFVTNSVNKDLAAILERTLKKEISSLGSSLARTITPAMEKVVSAAIADLFQRGVGDKAVGQLEKAVSSKLEVTVARQIQTQFQTVGKQALQDTLRSTLESSVIPAFEASCKAMFEQVDSAFRKGMVEHTNASQQQLDSTYSLLAVTLRDAINSASSITKNFTNDLAEGQRKLLALVASGNSKGLNPMGLQPSNGPLGVLSEMVEVPMDPTKELARLISERKFGEAFTLALQRSDVSIVSWLCSQVDLHAMCSPSNVPNPLSQGVLLSLLQQLAVEIANDTSRKLDWMTDVAAAINPVDPSISTHVRRIVEQVYNLLNMQRSVPTTSTADASKIRLLMHVLTSILMSCK